VSTTTKLRDSELFAHFEPLDLDSLLAATSRHDIAKGSALEGHLQTCFVEQGQLRLRRDTPYGPYLLRRVKAGEMLGEGHLLQQSPSVGEAIAGADLQLLALDGEALSALAEASSRFQLCLLWTLWKSLSSKLRVTNGRLTEFFSADSGRATEQRPSLAEPEEDFRVDLQDKRGVFAEHRLSSLEINFLTTLSKERRYESGQAIFHEGEPAETMYVVLEGKVRISKHIPGAGEEALSFLERGAFFGEMALIESQARSATAVAHGGKAIVLGIPREVLRGLLDIKKVSSTRLLRLLCELLARRLNELDDKLVGWHILSAGSRPTPPGG
jgi:CRP/FNR family cyclic AMP-dependent transcriptional regulator